MNLEDRLIGELKEQSKRDLEEAQKILECKGHMEHVAWNCEQAYEKLVKSMYAHFKLKIQGRRVKSVYGTLYEKKHFESHTLVINMLNEIGSSFRNCAKASYAEFQDHLETAREVIAFSGVNNAIPGYDKNFKESLAKNLRHAKSEISKHTLNINNFSDFLAESSGEKLLISLEKNDVNQTIPRVLSQLRADPKHPLSHPSLKQYVDIAISNVDDYKKFYNFILKALLLAPYAIPHTTLSRYPSDLHNFANLEVYRSKEDVLKPFFKILIAEIEKMHKESDGFLEALVHFKSHNMV